MCWDVVSSNKSVQIWFVLMQNGFSTFDMKIGGREVLYLQSHYFGHFFSLAYVNQSEFRFGKVLGFFDGYQTQQKKIKNWAPRSILGIGEVKELKFSFDS
jgi:hypothetical protein